MNLDACLFDYRNQYASLPDNALAQYRDWVASLADENVRKEALAAIDARDAKALYRAAKWMYFQRSLGEARRLGLKPHPMISFRHNECVVLVDYARGETAGQALAAKHGFQSQYRPPETMWDILAWRRDNDAIVALIGDDRGGAKYWEFYVAVAWSPKALARKWAGRAGHTLEGSPFAGTPALI